MSICLCEHGRDDHEQSENFDHPCLLCGCPDYQRARKKRISTLELAANGEAEERINELEEAIRLTQEFLMDDTLPRLAGWSWWDAIGCNDCQEPTMKWNPFSALVECELCGKVR